MNKDMLMVTICQEFGWDFYTYMSQPSFFIDLIREKLVIDNKEMEKNLKKSNRGKKW